MSIFLRDSYGASGLSAGQILRDPGLLLAFGFGTGLSRYMPGTLGTLAAVPPYLALMQLGDGPYLPIAAVLTTLAGVYLCDRAAAKLQVHDYGGIVWDEIAGFLLTMCWLPFSWPALAAGFLLFRLLDILKPWPIGWLDRHVHGGLGIILDDVAAGLLAGALLWPWF